MVTLDPDSDTTYWVRPRTFFVNIPNSVYTALMFMCYEQNKDFQTIFVEAIKLGLEKLKLEVPLAKEV